MNKQKNLLLPLVFLFVIFNGLFIASAKFLARWHIDNYVMIIANTLFLLVSIGIFMMQKKALTNNNPHAFVRSVMGGMMIKMFVCIIGVFIYKFTMKEEFSGNTVLAAVILYLIYNVVEVRMVTKLNRKKNA